MDNIRQKNWFSITAYVVTAIAVLSLLLFIAENYFPSQPSFLIPGERDRISRRLLSTNAWNQRTIPSAEKTAVRGNLVLTLNKKVSLAKSEFIYRGLVGSDFRIDVIIPELDPQAAYSYRIDISEAKKSFRLANRTYRLISAKKAVLRLRQID